MSDNKNVTAAARAVKKAATDHLPTRHFCECENLNCPAKTTPITRGELQPVQVTSGGKGRMRFYRKACRA